MKLPWNDATAAACGIDDLVRAIAPGCGFGRTALARTRAFAPGDEDAASAASRRAVAVARSASVDRIALLRAAVAATPDPLSASARATAGETLSDADFHDLVRFVDALAALGTKANGIAEATIPAPIDGLAACLAPGRAPSGGFYLDDAFDPALADARDANVGAQAAHDLARSRLASRASAALRDAGASVRDGEFILMRDAAPAELPIEIRVLREAPTYLLCELAPDDENRIALAERDAAAGRVADAEERVRARLSAEVAAHAVAIGAACAVLGDLDLLTARAAYAARTGGVVPDLASGEIALVAACLPPLADRLAARGRAYVPISLRIDGPAVVTGPNMGGKTAALRTLGFAAACAVLGVPVPATAARVPLFAEIVWLGIAGDAAETSDDGALLSAFGAEVLELRAFLDRTPAADARPALVLLDEFARTTSPREGRALLVAVLETLRERRILGLAATHFAGVAGAAAVAHFAIGRLRSRASDGAAPVSLAAALERIAAGMDYALERTDDDGSAGADALTLARDLGLDAALVTRAERALRSAGA